jgi:hypothetical protein
MATQYYIYEGSIQFLCHFCASFFLNYKLGAVYHKSITNVNTRFSRALGDTQDKRPIPFHSHKDEMML